MGASILWIVEPDAALRPIIAAAVDGMLPEACVAEIMGLLDGEGISG